jgi:hypothetical protein
VMKKGNGTFPFPLDLSFPSMATALLGCDLSHSGNSPSLLPFPGLSFLLYEFTRSSLVESQVDSPL